MPDGKEKINSGFKIKIRVSKSIIFFTTEIKRDEKGSLCPATCPVFFILTIGLRKLEAFFGLLITIMAVTFGYEV